MSIFDTDLGAVQQASVETRDKKTVAVSGEGYFHMPKKADGTPYEKLELVVGANRFDILPFRYAGGVIPNCLEGKLSYKLDFDVYKNIGPSNSAVVSLKQLMKNDPIANELSNLYTAQKAITSEKERDAFYETKIKPLRAQRRCVYVALHHTTDDKGKAIKVPKIFDASHFKFEKELLKVIDKEAAKGNNVGIFSSPLAGSTILIMGEEATFNKNTYVDIASVDFIPRTKQLAKDEASALALLDTIPKLDSCLNIKTPAEVEVLLYGAPLHTEEVEEKLVIGTTKKTPVNIMFETPEEDAVEEMPEDDGPTSDDEDDDFQF